MKFNDPSERVLLPIIISVRADTATLLKEMASEMDVPLEEVISAMAEDSVIELEERSLLLEEVQIPDSCSIVDLLKFIK